MLAGLLNVAIPAHGAPPAQRAQRRDPADALLPALPAPARRRHPASGYVQGINDLVTPFMAVFMSEHLGGPIEGWSVGGCSDDLLLDIEADCYWWG